MDKNKKFGSFILSSFSLENVIQDVAAVVDAEDVVAAVAVVMEVRYLFSSKFNQIIRL